MRIVMMGTRGVPARYGGFETAVEEVGTRLVSRGHAVLVYSRDGARGTSEYRGVTSVTVPALRSKYFETASHTAASVAHLLRRRVRPDAVFLFNAGNSPLLPAMRASGLYVAVHIDGLEWQRDKWAGVGRWYYHAAERLGVSMAHEVIADAHGIADYVREKYGRSSTYIPYGAAQISSPLSAVAVGGHEFAPRDFHLCVARFEPENHVLQVVQGYARSDASRPLVVVGGAPYGARYSALIEDAARGHPGVQLVGPVWDQDLLNALYRNCLSYLHGHSVGGTNPSLLRAMGAAAPVSAFDVNFNREVTGGHALFFSDPDSVAACLRADEQSPAQALERGLRGQKHALGAYDWEDVASKYEEVAARGQAHRRLGQSHGRLGRNWWLPRPEET